MRSSSPNEFVDRFRLQLPVHYENPRTVGVGPTYPITLETDWHNLLTIAKWQGIPRQAQPAGPPVFIFHVGTRPPTPAPSPRSQPSLPNQRGGLAPSPLAAPASGTAQDPIAVSDTEPESEFEEGGDIVPEDDARGC